LPWACSFLEYFFQPRPIKRNKNPLPLAKNTPSRDLHKIGEAIAKAVLDKNLETLLSFDRADLRSLDEAALKNTKSNLYCYISIQSALRGAMAIGDRVYDKLSQAHSLEIRVSVSSSRYDRQCTEACFSMTLRGFRKGSPLAGFSMQRNSGQHRVLEVSAGKRKMETGEPALR